MKRLILLLGIAASICSCQQNDELQVDGNDSKVKLSRNEYLSVAFDNPETVTEAQALEIVKGFISTNTNSRGVTNVSPSVTKKIYLNGSLSRSKSDNLPTVPVYEIALNTPEDKGFALVSGDERMPCVLAYSEKGEINDTVTNKGAALMLKEATASLVYNIGAYNQLKDSLREKTLQKIAENLGRKNVSFDDVKELIAVQDGAETRSVAYPNPSVGTLWKEVKPVIQTRWNQDSPYNNALDPTSYEEFQGIPYYDKNPVGCTGVAVAQIVAHFEVLSSAYGVNLIWSQLKASPTISRYNAPLVEQVSNLCKHVAKGINTNWTASGGGASLKSASSYLNGLGVTFDTGSKYGGYSMDVGRVLESLDGYPLPQPVFVTGNAEAGSRSTGGGGHCWLLDGYQMRRRPTTTRQILKTSDIYIHANFGWSGHEDGYYMVDKNSASLDFKTSGNGFYNTNLKIFPYIRKK